MANDQLFIDTFAAIECDPSRWRQSMWATDQNGYLNPGWLRDGYLSSPLPADCGTAYCFAGHIAAVDPDVQWLNWSTLLIGDAVAEIDVYAALALEINKYEANALFREDNTLDQLYQIAAVITGMDEEVLRDKVTQEKITRGCV